MIDATFEVTGAEAVARAFRTARPRLMDRWERTTRRGALRAVRIWQTKYRGAGRTSASATRQGTGALRGSIAQRVRRLGDVIEGLIGLYRFGAKGQALIYGAVHEEGARIRSARAGGMLAIPLAAVRSPSGIAPPPRSFPDAFVLRKGPFGSGGLLVRREGGRIIPLFALRREVTVPARPPGGAINAAVAEVEPQLTAELLRDAERLLEAGE